MRNGVKSYALISVSDKTGIVDFAKGLAELGFDILSTGGTYKTLKDNGIKAMEVSELTGFAECLDGRVKTLHPIIHAGILALRSNAEHLEHLKKLKIDRIDLVCVNLYPFLETIKKPNVSFEVAVENIDIGGPTMIRAAAKNYGGVLPVCYPEDYSVVLEKLKSKEDDIEFRKYLMSRAFTHTAFYDAVVSNYLNKDKLPEYLILPYKKHQAMRYGENPHQAAAFYSEPIPSEVCLSNAKFLQGKELSFNNINDTNGAINALRELGDDIACVAVKHATPCGIAIGKDIFDAYKKAYEADSESIFGGIIALNQKVDKKTALEMTKIFLEVVVAPSFDKDALEVFAAKPNLRILELPALTKKAPIQMDKKFVVGGVLLQDGDCASYDLKVVTKAKPDKKTIKDLLFGYKVAKHLKSNAIAIVSDGQTIGLGGGQTSRVEAVKIALDRAKEKAKGTVLASDGFFPFNDCIEIAHKNGIRAIIQPGGSKNDEAAIKLCDELGIPMVFTGIRHFKH